jgi:Cytochrome C oxidase, cbb3-type, subunit III
MVCYFHNKGSIKGPGPTKTFAAERSGFCVVASNPGRFMNRLAAAAVAISFLFALPRLSVGTGVAGGPSLHPGRESDTDLEIGGDLAGLPTGSTRFISYNDLLTLPQTTYIVSDDGNFDGKTRVSGIPLIELAQHLGMGGDAKLVVAICYDGYRANYPTAYLAAHRPLLVLKIDGKTENNWPKSKYGGSLGPYLISNPAFTPSFKVLSHTDEPQIPFGVTRLEFRDERVVLGSIAPPGKYPPNSPVIAGYRIAQQNCFRCHNMGAEGGRMSGRSWPILGMWASTEPDYFSRYVKNPKAIDPKNHMPGFPQYDAATIDALRQYFSTFARVGQPGGNR